MRVFLAVTIYVCLSAGVAQSVKLQKPPPVVPSVGAGGDGAPEKLGPNLLRKKPPQQPVPSGVSAGGGPPSATGGPPTEPSPPVPSGGPSRSSINSPISPLSPNTLVDHNPADPPSRDPSIIYSPNTAVGTDGIDHTADSPKEPKKELTSVHTAAGADATGPATDSPPKPMHPSGKSFTHEVIKGTMSATTAMGVTAAVNGINATALNHREVLEHIVQRIDRELAKRAGEQELLVRLIRESLNRYSEMDPM